MRNIVDYLETSHGWQSRRWEEESPAFTTESRSLSPFVMGSEYDNVSFETPTVLLRNLPWYH